MAQDALWQALPAAAQFQTPYTGWNSRAPPSGGDPMNTGWTRAYEGTLKTSDRVWCGLMQINHSHLSSAFKDGTTTGLDTPQSINWHNLWF